MLDQCHPVAQNHFKPILSRERETGDVYHWISLGPTPCLWRQEEGYWLLEVLSM